MSKPKIITKEIGFTTDLGAVENVTLEFTLNDLTKIALCQGLIRKYDLFCIELAFYASNIKSLDSDDEFFSAEVQRLKVYANSVYFVFQNKYSAGCQYESEGILNSELF